MGFVWLDDRVKAKFGTRAGRHGRHDLIPPNYACSCRRRGLAGRAVRRHSEGQSVSARPALLRRGAADAHR